MKTKIITLVLLMIVMGAMSPIQKTYYYATGSGAIRGYDPVAYFKQGEPIKGTSEYVYLWEGVNWYFGSQENLEAFKATPENYAPQFGGYCAYAVSRGYTAKVDPTAWKIVDGKLYLNYSHSIKRKWEAGQAEYIKKAEGNWPDALDN